MTLVLGGPLFNPSEDEDRVSLFDKPGGHYNVYECRPGRAMAFLRKVFPQGKANDLNFVLFSTSGVHGSYRTLEDIVDEWGDHELRDLTFLLVQPRLVSMTYGNIEVEATDIEFLQTLRSSSWKAVRTIGRSRKPPPTKDDGNG